MVRGEQSERLMDLRVACLDHHLQRLGAVVDVLQTADPDVVENALDAVANLPPVARCSDPRALLDEVAPPEDPAIAAEVEAIRSELATAAAHAAAGQHEVSYMSLPALLERARATGHLPVVAEVARQVGVDLEQFGRIDEAVAHFEESLWASIEAGDAMAEAQALEGLTSVVGNNDPASGTALRHGRHLQAVLGRLGDPPEEVAMASLYLGTAHMRMRHWDEAEAHYRRALEVDTGTPRAHRVRLSATANLAAVHGMRGDLAQAREVGGRALELAIARLGPRHPTVASLLHNQGTIATSLGEWHEALDLFERSVAIREATSGRAHPEVGRALQNLGVVLRALGRHEQALAVSLEALEIKQATLGSEGPSVAMAVNNVGDVLLDLNRPAEALQRFEAAIAAWGESNDRIFALIGVAESQSALGRHHLALAAALETLELMKSVPLDARNRGRFRLGAARVLWEAGEIGRAQSLAVQAREDYSEAQGNTQSELHEVEAWLAAHGGG
jgi:tetratricopeptide (TPR) repeat protein